MRKEIEQTVISSLWFILFVTIAMGVIYLIFWGLTKKKKNIKKYGFLQLFAGLNSVEIVSLSMLTIRFLYFCWCFTQPRATILVLVVLIVVGLVYNAMNRRFWNMIADVVNSGILYAVLVAKGIFSDYLTNVAAVWHVAVFTGLLIAFGMLYAGFFYLKDVKKIMIDSNKRLYSKKEPKAKVKA